MESQMEHEISGTGSLISLLSLSLALMTDQPFSGREMRKVAMITVWAVLSRTDNGTREGNTLHLGFTPIRERYVCSTSLESIPEVYLNCQVFKIMDEALFLA